MRELGASEVLDFITDNSDASLVGGVQFEDAGAVEGGAEERFGEGKDCGCFSCSWWSVEEHVWELWSSC